MGWTKGRIISEAYGELALQGYDFDITPEEQQTALRRLDTMMATWEGKGIRLGYAFPDGPDGSDPSQPAGLPDVAIEAAYLNLAIRLAAGFGKQLTVDTKRTAREAYDTLLRAAAQPIEQQLPNTMPRGAGNKPWGATDRPFFGRPNFERLVSNDPGALDILE